MVETPILAGDAPLRGKIGGFGAQASRVSMSAMRIGPVSLFVAVLLALAAPAWAQSSNPPPSDGALTVCCGGTFGYVGGSGGVSGRVVGPGGGGGTTAVRPAPAPAKPSALNSGVVAPAKLPVVHIPAETASASGHPDVLTWAMIALMVIGAVFVYRKLPHTA